MWITKSKTLIEDAVRDWTDLGGAPTDIVPLERWKPDEAITLGRGILFVTYATLRSVGKTGRTRLEQLVDWCGGDYEGVIAFDEAHAMANAAGSSDGARGGTAPSQQGIAGLRLQIALPRARVLYVSATGATNVSNLAYAMRLGLWGPGQAYPFATREDFVAAMVAGGVAAMEVVARDLKALGLYTARALSFEGVEYDILEHRLSEDERAVYDRFAAAFKVIHRNLHAALEATGITDAESGVTAGAAKASALSRFEGMKQRFFGHVLNGFKAGTLIRAIEDDLAEGWAPVVQIVSTGESHLDRALEGLDGDDLTEAHLTPKETVIHWLRTAFPVQAHRLVEIEGMLVAERLTHEDGSPVLSREAEALRDAALMELYTVAPIPSVLDRLVWHFGEERLAEVTGRAKRSVRVADGALKVIAALGVGELRRGRRLHGRHQGRAALHGRGRDGTVLPRRRHGRQPRPAPPPLPRRARLARGRGDPGARAHAPLGAGHGALVPRADDGRARREAVHLDHRAAPRHPRRPHPRPARDRQPEPVPRLRQPREPGSRAARSSRTTASCWAAPARGATPARR